MTNVSSHGFDYVAVTQLLLIEDLNASERLPPPNKQWKLSTCNRSSDSL